MNKQIDINVRDYLSTISKEKDLYSRYNLIETGKTPHENFNKHCIPTFPEEIDEQYGLTMILMRLITGLDSTNLNLVEVNELWERINTEYALIYNTFPYMRMWKLNSYIIHDIKYCIDMLISVIWWMMQEDRTKDIRIASIGDYLSGKDTDFSFFNDYKEFFVLINDIENAHKHSVPNATLGLVGREEPVIYALKAPYNKDIFSPELKGITLKQLVRGFNEFFHLSLQLIRELAEAKADKLRGDANDQL